MHIGSNVSIATIACLPACLTIYKTWCSLSPIMQACWRYEFVGSPQPTCLRCAHDSVAPIVEPARPRLCRRRQASFGSHVGGYLNGVLPPGANTNPAVILRHLQSANSDALKEI